MDDFVAKISFVNEAVGGGFPVDQFLGLEPKRDLLLGRLLGVGTVNDVATQIDAEVTTNGSWERLLRVGLAHHHTASLGGVLAFPNHGDNGSRRDEIDELVVEGLVLQVDVMLLNMLP